MGKKIDWNAQKRKADEINKEAPTLFKTMTVFGMVLGFSLWKKSLSIFLFFSPILIGWVFSIPILLLLSLITEESFSNNSDEINLLKIQIDKNMYRYHAVNLLHPIYLLCKDPKFFYTHLSFLKKKKNPSKKFLDLTRKKATRLSEKTLYNLTEKEIKLLFNNRELLIEYRNLILQGDILNIEEYDEIYNQNILTSYLRYPSRKI